MSSAGVPGASELSQPSQRLAAAGGVALSLDRVVADDPAHPDPVVAGAVEPDFGDPQVVADLPVAALAGQRCLRAGVAVPQPFAGDPVPTGAAQVVQIGGRGEAAALCRHRACAEARRAATPLPAAGRR